MNELVLKYVRTWIKRGEQYLDDDDGDDKTSLGSVTLPPVSSELSPSISSTPMLSPRKITAVQPRNQAVKARVSGRKG